MTVIRKLACAALMLAAPGLPSGAHAEISLEFIGEVMIPSGTQIEGTTLGGLSGVDYDPATDRYIAISDDRSEADPARFYTFDLALSSAAFTGVSFTAVTTLLQEDGTPYPPASIDAEAIRFAGAGRIIYTSEGEDRPDLGRVTAPFVRLARLDGSYLASLQTPALYQPTLTTGIRNNLAFESLAITPGGTIVTATENALKQDGPAASPVIGSPARIQTFAAGGEALAAYVYPVEPVPVPPVPADGFATNGLSDMLALSDTRFLAIERSYSTGIGNSVRLFQVDISGATDVSGLAVLSGSEQPVTKVLVLDLATLGIPLDNIEGITFGQTLEDGSRSLILVSDDNFSATQFTQLLAFRYSETASNPAH